MKERTMAEALGRSKSSVFRNIKDTSVAGAERRKEGRCCVGQEVRKGTKPAHLCCTPGNACPPEPPVIAFSCYRQWYIFWLFGGNLTLLGRASCIFDTILYHDQCAILSLYYILEGILKVWGHSPWDCPGAVTLKAQRQPLVSNVALPF